MVTSVNPNAPVSRAQNGEKPTETSMNGELTPNEIGMEFVRQYYTLMNEAPQYLYRLYSKESKFVHGNITGKHQVPVIGQENIKVEIERLNFQHVYTKIRQVDCYSTLYDLLIVLICGDISILKTPARRFAQQIVLAPQGPLKYYVVNDIFRYIDEGDDHVENEMETESSSEGPEEDISQQVPPPALSHGTSEGQKQIPSHVMNDQAHHPPPPPIMDHPSAASGDIMRSDLMTANSTEGLALDPNIATTGMRGVTQEPGSLSGTPQLDENVMQSMGSGATGPQVPMMPGGQNHHMGQPGGETVMNSFGNVTHPDAHMQPPMHGSADSNGVVEQSSFMPQKKPQQTEELFDQASTEVQLSTSDTTGQPDESAHFNSTENSSDVGASYQPVNDTGIKTWASITGAVGASPVKKPQSDSRGANNQHTAPPQQQFQVQHASSDSFGPSSHPKPPRNPGGGKNFHAHGDVNLVSPPNEPRGSNDRRSGGRSSGPQFGGGHPGNQQSSSQQMNIGTFPPKSESPGAKFQSHGNSGGGNPSFGRGGPPMSGSFGGPGNHPVIPDEWQIFVGNLPPDVNNEELRRRFGEFGNVIDVRISRGGAVPFGFVAFDAAAPVQKILEKTQGPDRQTLFLRNEKHRINIEEKKPRGVGGGSGGRSGGGRFPSGGGGPSGKSAGPREGGGGSNSKFFKSGPPGGGGPGKGGPGGPSGGSKGGAQNLNNNSNANYINNSPQMQNSFQQGSGNPGGRR